MSSIKIGFMSTLLLFLGACSLFEPFVDRRRNAGQTDVQKIYIGQSTPDKPAICANGLWTSEEKIKTLADAECQKHHTGTHAVLTSKTHMTCKLLIPTHIYFKCEQ